MPNLIQSSLRKEVLTSIGNFLWQEGFAPNELLQQGVLQIINLISDYYEEGKPLFPEIIITNDLQFLDPIIPKILPIKRHPLTVDEFGLAVKLCAPLSVNGWVIYIEVKDEYINYGMASADVDETSPSMYSQTVGDLKNPQNSFAAAYLRNAGQKVVELAGIKSRLIVSLNLDEPTDYSLNEVHQLSVSIIDKCDEKFAINLKTYIEKLIDGTLKIGHGNLIGVIDDTEENIAKVKESLKGNGGIYLKDPIDFQALLVQTDENKDSQSSVNLRSYAVLLQSMINHDGITILTNKARVIGYHMLIDAYVNETDKITGGARSKAFLSMKNCELFSFCFYKSQDGNLKIWKKP